VKGMDINMKKELAMFEPMIKGFNIYGSLFSILTNDNGVKNWICNNFIQLRYLGNDINVVFFENYRHILYNCPRITVTQISRNLLKSKWNNDVLQFIKEMVDENYYILLYIDRYYVTDFHKTHNSVHELFIYGYDYDNNVLLCADNIGEGQYDKFQCPVDQFRKAYWNLPECSYYSDFNCITSEFGSDSPDEISLPKIYKLLKDYIDSDITVNFGERFTVSNYGFEIHNIINNNINNIEVNKDIDVRPIYTIYEHKIVMIFRLERLNEFLETDKFDPFIKLYSQIREKYEIILAFIEKYNLTHKSKDLSRITDQFDTAINIEKSLFHDLMKVMEKFKS
jgi:hypothetical protein